ncbi:hypothetical protein [Flexivirga oryzae]|uniref:Uncharacterized protein n=1 Tax=Flexivirga oryzae TaxID=1794944 RepID=A0A839N8Z0_9MICO|nr:hypothetical protein [Flexivirga oryzae]MBB2891122.1 hypothetical protein [Flexivirga oryzae]
MSAAKALRSYRARGGRGREDAGLDLGALVERYGATCWHTGCERAAVQIGHGVSVANGGDHTFENTRPVCAECNKRTGGSNMPGFKSVAEWGGSLEQLLDEADDLLARHTGFDEVGRTVVACHAIAARTALSFSHFPMTVFTSDKPGAGKSVGLRVVAALAGTEASLRSDSGAITPAAFKRKQMDVGCSVVMLDEISGLDKNLQAVLRSGVDRTARDSLTIPKGKNDWEVEEFTIYCAYFGAGLDDEGSMDTRRDTRDREFRLDLETPGDRCVDELDEFATTRFYEALDTLAAHADGWAAENLPIAKDLHPERPETEMIGTPRDLDMTRPLLVVGGMAGTKWKLRADQAYLWRQGQRLADRAEPTPADYQVYDAAEWLAEHDQALMIPTTVAVRDHAERHPDIGTDYRTGRTKTPQRYAAAMRHAHLYPQETRGLWCADHQLCYRHGEGTPHRFVRAPGYRRAALEGARQALHPATVAVITDGYTPPSSGESPPSPASPPLRCNDAEFSETPKPATSPPQARHSVAIASDPLDDNPEAVARNRQRIRDWEDTGGRQELRSWVDSLREQYGHPKRGPWNSTKGTSE